MTQKIKKIIIEQQGYIRVQQKKFLKKKEIKFLYH